MGQCMSRPPVKSDIPAPIPLENKDDVDMQQEQAKSTRSLGQLFSKNEVPNCAVVTEEVAPTVSAAKTVETIFTLHAVPQTDVDEGIAQACESKLHEVIETKEVDKPPEDDGSKTLQDIEDSKHDHVHYEEKGEALNSEGILSAASCVENVVLPSRGCEIPDEKIHSLVINTIETKAIVLEEKLETIGKEVDDLKQQTYEEEERRGENIYDIKNGGLSGESIIENGEPCEVASLAKSGEGLSSETISSKAFPSEIAQAVIITGNQETEAALVSQDKEISPENSSGGECKDAEIKEIIAEKTVNEVEQPGEYESSVGVVQNTNGKCLEDRTAVEKQNTLARIEGLNEVESAGKLMQDKSQNPGIITMKDETPLESTLLVVPAENSYSNAEPTQIVAISAEGISEESAGTREPLEGRVDKVINVVLKEAIPSDSLPKDTNSIPAGESAVTKEVLDEVREVSSRDTTTIPVSDVKLQIGSELINSEENMILHSQEKTETNNEIDAEPVTATCITGNAVGSEDIIADLASEEGILQKVANEPNTLLYATTIETTYFPEDHYVEKGSEELNSQEQETSEAFLDAIVIAAEKSEKNTETDAVESDSKKDSDEGMQGTLEAPLALTAIDGCVKVEDMGTIEQSRQDASVSSEIKETLVHDIEIEKANAIEQSMQDSSENKEIIINDESPGAIEQCWQDTSISNETKEVILHNIEGDTKHNEPVVKNNPSSESTDSTALLKEKVPVANVLPSESSEGVECTSSAAEVHSAADMDHVNVGGQ